MSIYLNLTSSQLTLVLYNSTPQAGVVSKQLENIGIKLISGTMFHKKKMAKKQQLNTEPKPAN